MVGEFLIWCAGSDKSVLSKCSDAERTKHIGYGTLVLIPAVLAFVSMSYALSTVDKIKDVPKLNYLGGVVWGLIIFALDRFIVSTHRRKKNNLEEFKNINLYLRLVFAFFLGVVSSHPFVLLYFNGSITEEIKRQQINNIRLVDSSFNATADTARLRLNELIEHKQCLERLITAEQSGHKVVLYCGYSSGIPNISGSFPRTEQLKKLIAADSILINEEQARVNARMEVARTRAGDQRHFYISQGSDDYLKRERTLAGLKTGNSIISYSQIFLMIVLILLDISAVTFKTFAPFGMYDKILTDDIELLINIDTSSRKEVLQGAYEEISGVYADAKNIKKEPEHYKNLFSTISSRYHFQRNILTGIVVGFLFFLFTVLYVDSEFSSDSIFAVFTFPAVMIGLAVNFLHDFIKQIFKNR